MGITTKGLTDVQLRNTEVPISAASLPLPSGASTEAKQDTGNSSLAAINSKIDTTLSTRASETTLSTRLSESDFDTKTGSLTETAPVTDTASSGLNGRLQRIAQRLTSLISLVPTSLGQKTGANSFAVVLASDQNNSTANTEGSVSAGTAATKSILIGGVYNSTLPTLTNGQQSSAQFDINGNLKTTLQNVTINVVPVGTLASYSASATLLTVAATPTDIFLIKGSATKRIKISRLFFSGIQTNASTSDLFLIKRSADNTGGTRSTLTTVPHDSTDAAATAQIFSYTANPSALGTSVGVLRAAAVNIPNKNSVGSINAAILELSAPPQKNIILNNANEYLAINLNAISIPGSSLNITVDWTEE